MYRSVSPRACESTPPAPLGAAVGFDANEAYLRGSAPYHRLGPPEHRHLGPPTFQIHQSLEPLEHRCLGSPGTPSPGVDAASMHRLRSMGRHGLGSAELQHLLKIPRISNICYHRSISVSRCCAIIACETVGASASLGLLCHDRLGLPGHHRDEIVRPSSPGVDGASSPRGIVGSAGRHQRLRMGSQWRLMTQTAENRAAQNQQDTIDWGCRSVWRLEQSWIYLRAYYGYV